MYLYCGGGIVVANFQGMMIGTYKMHRKCMLIFGEGLELCCMSNGEVSEKSSKTLI